MSKNYKDTLNLPKTDFPMKADLVKREPERLAKWESAKLYERIQEARKDAELFVLHDGPPFANGDVHMGTALNKILKDIIVKSKTMAGYRAPFVPGWDCHGLPIEFKVVKESRGLTPLAVRQKSEAYARKYIDIQRRQFKRLGVFGDWENPYLTLAPGYEAEIIRAFAKFVELDLVYQSKKPVYWSTGAQTALAEAEVEYADREDAAIFVKFPIISGELAGLASMVIWTTTPWTLPANVAIALHPRHDYVVGDFRTPQSDRSEQFVIASALIPAFTETTGYTLVVQGRSFRGASLAGIEAQHPFLDRKSRVIVAEFVTMETGTGQVHIAPGHGSDDYIAGVENGLPILSPVDEHGRFTEEVGVPVWAGKYVFDANKDVIAHLRENGTLIGEQVYKHSYPHCWRSKTPIVFRAVEQFFIRIDKLRGPALAAIDDVKWLPHWGRNRIYGTVESRPDWCISRQRSWGVPLPVFYGADSKPILDAAIIREVANLIEKRGTNVWFELSTMELLKEAGILKNVFLLADRVRCEEDAVKKAISAAFQTQNPHGKIYASGVNEGSRTELRNSLTIKLRKLAEIYILKPVSEEDHVKNICELADSLTKQHTNLLSEGRFRIGISQKSLNLYLKYLWCLGKLPNGIEPPHCPVDGIVLRAAEIQGNWTELDCPQKYQRWIVGIKTTASTQSISSWELEVWQKNKLKDKEWTRRNDTLDVWMDSGVSHEAVLRKNPALHFPADVYIEATDQHRGWFQSSLMTSVAMNGVAPYKTCITHGFVVDVDGKKISKSSSYQKPMDAEHFVGKHGADIVRLWVSSVNFTDEVPFSEEMFTRLADTYRRIRNTLRILHANLYDFDVTKNAAVEFTMIDRWVLGRLQEVIAACREGYASYEFHKVYHALNQFCAVDLSSLYVDITKDRMYCDAADSPRRRATQTVMHAVFDALTRLLAPILVFTADEAREFFNDTNSVHAELFPEADAKLIDPALNQRVDALLNLRGTIGQAVEQARQEKLIGNALEGSVTLQIADEKLVKSFADNEAELEEFFILSELTFASGKETKAAITPIKHKKCERCWRHRVTVGASIEHTELCDRCERVVKTMSN